MKVNQFCFILKYEFLRNIVIVAKAFHLGLAYPIEIHVIDRLSYLEFWFQMEIDWDTVYID